MEKIQVLYEDNHVIVVVKPYRIPSQEGIIHGVLETQHEFVKRVEVPAFGAEDEGQVVAFKSHESLPALFVRFNCRELRARPSSGRFGLRLSAGSKSIPRFPSSPERGGGCLRAPQGDIPASVRHAPEE